ncbi:MAG: heparinase, partial [Flavobacteriaceae bacterium]
PKQLQPLGKKYGYQHLWNEGVGVANSESIQFTWLHHQKFYTITAATHKKDEILFARIGANDPEFNLRRDPTLILRKQAAKHAVFASVIASHGVYSPVTEKADNAYTPIVSVKVLLDTTAYTAIEVGTSDKNSLLILSNEDNASEKMHTVTIDNKNYRFQGAYYYKSTK